MQHIHFISKRTNLKRLCSTSSTETGKPLPGPWETLQWSATVLIVGFTWAALALGISYVYNELNSESKHGDSSRLKNLEKRLSQIEENRNRA